MASYHNKMANKLIPLALTGLITVMGCSSNDEPEVKDPYNGVQIEEKYNKHINPPSIEEPEKNKEVKRTKIFDQYLTRRGIEHHLEIFDASSLSDTDEMIISYPNQEGGRIVWGYTFKPDGSNKKGEVIEATRLEKNVNGYISRTDYALPKNQKTQSTNDLVKRTLKAATEKYIDLYTDSTSENKKEISRQ